MNRIELLASLCSNSKCVCDIGCDHAYALTYAILNFGVKRGIACDIAEGPLLNAKNTIRNYHLEDRIATILSNGFDNVNADSFDTAIIAGMGGILICEILGRAISKLKNKKLIIEANSDTYRIRELLIGNGFIIEDEFAIYDNNKYYEIVVFVSGNYNYSNLDVLYGPILRRNRPEAFIRYYTNKIRLLKDIISKINNEEEKKKKIEFLEEISFLLKE